MKTFKELKNLLIKEDWAQDLDLAHKNMVRLTNKETGQDKKDYAAVTRALNQGNLGAVKKVIKSIKSTEIQADILNVLVGYNDLIAKMYPKAVDSKGRLKTPMNVGKMIKDDVNEETIEEAMSDKDKAKRLALIKKAVEKINKNNADKAKKDALAMMKQSGMFDEGLQEKLGFNGSYQRKSKFDGKEFDRKKELMQLKKIQKVLEQADKLHADLQYPHTVDTVNGIWDHINKAYIGIQTYIGHINKGEYDGTIDMDD